MGSLEITPTEVCAAETSESPKKIEVLFTKNHWVERVWTWFNLFEYVQRFRPNVSWEMFWDQHLHQEFDACIHETCALIHILLHSGSPCPCLAYQKYILKRMIRFLHIHIYISVFTKNDYLMMMHKQNIWAFAAQFIRLLEESSLCQEKRMLLENLFLEMCDSGSKFLELSRHTISDISQCPYERHSLFSLSCYEKKIHSRFEDSLPTSLDDTAKHLKADLTLSDIINTTTHVIITRELVSVTENPTHTFSSERESDCWSLKTVNEPDSKLEFICDSLLQSKLNGLFKMNGYKISWITYKTLELLQDGKLKRIFKLREADSTEKRMSGKDTHEIVVDTGESRNQSETAGTDSPQSDRTAEAERESTEGVDDSDTPSEIDDSFQLDEEDVEECKTDSLYYQLVETAIRCRGILDNHTLITVLCKSMTVPEEERRYFNQMLCRRMESLLEGQTNDQESAIQQLKEELFDINCTKSGMSNGAALQYMSILRSEIDNTKSDKSEQLSLDLAFHKIQKIAYKTPSLEKVEHELMTLAEEDKYRKSGTTEAAGNANPGDSCSTPDKPLAEATVGQGRRSWRKLLDFLSSDILKQYFDDVKNYVNAEPQEKVEVSRAQLQFTDALLNDNRIARSVKVTVLTASSLIDTDMREPFYKIIAELLDNKIDDKQLKTDVESDHVETTDIKGSKEVVGEIVFPENGSNCSSAPVPKTPSSSDGSLEIIDKSDGNSNEPVTTEAIDIKLSRQLLLESLHHMCNMEYVPPAIERLKKIYLGNEVGQTPDSKSSDTSGPPESLTRSVFPSCYLLYLTYPTLNIQKSGRPEKTKLCETDCNSPSRVKNQQDEKNADNDESERVFYRLFEIPEQLLQLITKVQRKFRETGETMKSLDREALLVLHLVLDRPDKTSYEKPTENKQDWTYERLVRAVISLSRWLDHTLAADILAMAVSFGGLERRNVYMQFLIRNLEILSTMYKPEEGKAYETNPLTYVTRRKRDQFQKSEINDSCRQLLAYVYLVQEVCPGDVTKFSLQPVLDSKNKAPQNTVNIVLLEIKKNEQMELSQKPPSEEAEYKNVDDPQGGQEIKILSRKSIKQEIWRIFFNTTVEYFENGTGKQELEYPDVSFDEQMGTIKSKLCTLLIESELTVDDEELVKNLLSYLYEGQLMSTRKRALKMGSSKVEGQADHTRSFEELQGRELKSSNFGRKEEATLLTMEVAPCHFGHLPSALPEMLALDQPSAHDHLMFKGFVLHVLDEFEALNPDFLQDILCASVLLTREQSDVTKRTFVMTLDKCCWKRLSLLEPSERQRAETCRSLVDIFEHLYTKKPDKNEEWPTVYPSEGLHTERGSSRLLYQRL